MAEKTANGPGIVAMINVETPAPSRLCGGAYQAFPVLVGQHLVVGPERDAVSGAKNVLFREMRVLLAPLARLLRGAIQVTQAPFVLARARADAAVHSVPMQGTGVLVKFGQRLGVLAFGAAFEPAAEVECFPWHNSNRSSIRAARQEG